MLDEDEGRPKTPVDDVGTYVTPGSPESDDIYEEMDKEYQILERLYELYEQREYHSIILFFLHLNW